ncbi:hypothetical protein HETIRDRAFT_422315 [Heterobasidion irregulare TC 32-1]|uniref:Uncharacterized protein n=1 Tax=Heterobasidion irregulare (strain TC 32-1) TaxID=747525 RepID=W4JVT0_HETIT|nr:uncharacterized protein HETIRDRAFT_422315 [Heterobasidion irregulare TC 32-1]ETW76971.1 hypothetical protein HETIRDRAFT_422315 [Heterobasidion irregulare TC 32-1]
MEGMLFEHEAINREVSTLHELMEEEKRELDSVRGRRRSGTLRAEDHDDSKYGGDDDDAQSITTRVEDEDEEQLAAEEEEERRQRRDELGRPRTPEPTGMGMDNEDIHGGSKMHLDVLNMHSRSPSPPLREPFALQPSTSSVSEERLNALASQLEQLESALKLSRTLQAQQAAAQSIISMLESKISSLEPLVQASQTNIQSHTTEWSGVREEWAEERVRISRAREDWEVRVRAAEEGFDGAVTKVDAGLATLQQHQLKVNGNARHGVRLVTPLSPRNISSDSGKRHRRKRSTISRGRSRSHSAESNKDDGGYASSFEGVTLLDDKRQSASKARTRVPWAQDDSDSDVRRASDDARIMSLKHYAITSESSVQKASRGSTTTMTTEDDAAHASSAAAANLKGAHLAPMVQHLAQMSTTVGVLILT